MAACDAYSELISLRLDGALSPEEEARLEAHLEQCPHCRDLARDLEALHGALAGLPPVEVPADLSDRIAAAVAADKVLPLAPKKKLLPWKRWAAAAAVIALALLGSTQSDLFRPAPESAEVRVQPTVMAADTAPAGAEPDESRVQVTGGNYDMTAPSAENAPEPAAQEDITLFRNADYGGSSDALQDQVFAGIREAPAEEPAQKSEGSVQSRTAAILPGTAEAAEETDGAEEQALYSANSSPMALFSASPQESGEAALPSAALAAVPTPGGEGTLKSALARENALPGLLSPAQALELLLEGYPMPEEAQQVEKEDFLGWQTPYAPLAGDGDWQSSTRLCYWRLSPNGKYHEFRLYTSFAEDPETGEGHCSTLNFFAVPLEGGEVLVQRREVRGEPDSPEREAYEEGVRAYNRALSE